MGNADFIAKVDAFIKENEKDIIENIRTLVSIPSIEGKPEEGAPFGKEPKLALEKALEIAGDIGFATHNCENCLGYAHLDGTDDKHIVSITHLDVVPEGNGWTGDPFVMQEKEGYLIGRGVGDDKGPAVLSMYTGKFFKENGGLKYGYRMLFGTNEETGMADVKYYLKNYEPPVFAFSPDGAFPVCNGEKGVYGGQLYSGKIEDGNVIDFVGGVASNVVPDRAYALVKATAGEFPEAEGITVTAEEDGVMRVAGMGIGGHAASPKNTVNAIGRIVFYLDENNLISDTEKPYFEILKKVFSSTDGSTLGIDADDGLFDPLTCIGGIIKKEDGVFMQDINIRFPTNSSGEIIDSILEPMVKAVGGKLTHGMVSEPFYISPDSPAIQCLVDTYNEVTNSNEKPFLMGGGTYARHFPYAVSYGIGFPGENDNKPDFVGSAHGADEGVSIKVLMDSLKIYIIALARLNEIDF